MKIILNVSGFSKSETKQSRKNQTQSDHGDKTFWKTLQLRMKGWTLTTIPLNYFQRKPGKVSVIKAHLVLSVY